MRKLNLPEYEFRFKQEEESRYVLDVFRKRYVMFTPEFCLNIERTLMC